MAHTLHVKYFRMRVAKLNCPEGDLQKVFKGRIIDSGDWWVNEGDNVNKIYYMFESGVLL